jgi:hypothetical protein
MRLRQVLRHVRQAEFGQRRIQDLTRAVESKLHINVDIQIVFAFFGIPTRTNRRTSAGAN